LNNARGELILTFIIAVWASSHDVFSTVSDAGFGSGVTLKFVGGDSIIIQGISIYGLNSSIFPDGRIDMELYY